MAVTLSNLRDCRMFVADISKLGGIVIKLKTDKNETYSNIDFNIWVLFFQL